MDIQSHHIPLIEKCLNFKLYDHQKAYLLGTGALTGGRRTGKTVAYCVKLALSSGEPLNLNKPEEFADMWNLPHRNVYSRNFFRDEFVGIRNMLKDYGFEVRDVIERRY